MVMLGDAKPLNIVKNSLNGRDFINIVGTQNNEGKTVLHIAVEQGNPEILNSVLEGLSKASRYKLVNSKSKESLKSTVSTQDQQGRNVLHIAAQSGDNTLFSRLLNSMDKSVLVEMLNARDANGNTPIHLALASEIKGVKRVLDLCNQNTLLVPNNEGKLPSQCITAGSMFKESRGFVKTRSSIENKLKRAEQKAGIRETESAGSKVGKPSSSFYVATAAYDLPGEPEVSELRGILKPESSVPPSPLVSDSHSVSSSSSSIDFPEEAEMPRRVQKRVRFSDSSERSTTEVSEPPLETLPREYRVDVFSDDDYRTRVGGAEQDTLSSSSSNRSLNSSSSLSPESSSLDSLSTSSLDLDSILGDNLKGEIQRIAEGMSGVTQSDTLESDKVSPSSSQGTPQKKNSCMEK